MRLSDLFQIFGDEYLSRYQETMPPSHRKALDAILQCRTPIMGGKRYYCPKCRKKHYAYHSCNNRHCPQCGGDKTQGWLKNQFDRLLPVPYFFVTFTLPDTFRFLFRSHQRLCYSLFFEASSQALKDVASNKRFVGGQIGFFGVLQTWASNLIYHPHIHYIVPGVALSKNHKHWIKIKSKKFLVHCEPAGYGREVIQYVAPYVYRTAMTDHRPLVLHDDRTVSFTYKDHETKKRIPCRLDVMELFRRYLQHVLPTGFVKIRYFGLMGANQGRLLQHLKWLILKSISQKEQARFLHLHFEVIKRQLTCKACGTPLLLIGTVLPVRGP